MHGNRYRPLRSVWARRRRIVAGEARLAWGSLPTAQSYADLMVTLIEIAPGDVEGMAWWSAFGIGLKLCERVRNRS